MKRKEIEEMARNLDHASMEALWEENKSLRAALSASQERVKEVQQDDALAAAERVVCAVAERALSVFGSTPSTSRKLVMDDLEAALAALRAALAAAPARDGRKEER